LLSFGPARLGGRMSAEGGEERGKKRRAKRARDYIERR